MEYSHKSILLTSPSRAFGSIQRYIQGPGELNNVFEYGKKYGSRFLFLVDSGVFDMIRTQVEAIEDNCGWIAPVSAYPGEFELEAMAAGAIRVLSGEETPKTYTGIPVFQGFED